MKERYLEPGLEYLTYIDMMIVKPEKDMADSKYCLYSELQFATI